MIMTNMTGTRERAVRHGDAGRNDHGPILRPVWREGQGGGTVFEDDVMLPEQYFARLRHRADYPGEQRLLLAVLEDAVHCFQTNMGARTPRRRNLFHEAEEWLLEPGSEATVSFDYICDVFGLDAEHLRAGLRAWRDRQARERFQDPRSAVAGAPLKSNPASDDEDDASVLDEAVA